MGLTTWVLLAKQRSLSAAADAQGATGAFCDSCFTGSGLVGQTRLKSLRDSGVLRVQRVQARDGSKVRFGGGIAHILETLHCEVQVGAKLGGIALAVVSGCLPLLLGDLALREFGLVLDGKRGQVMQEGQCIGTWREGEMPTVELQRPGHLQTALAGAVDDTAGALRPAEEEKQRDAAAAEEERMEAMLERLLEKAVASGKLSRWSPSEESPEKKSQVQSPEKKSPEVQSPSPEKKSPSPAEGSPGRKWRARVPEGPRVLDAVRKIESAKKEAEVRSHNCEGRGDRRRQGRKEQQTEKGVEG